MGVRIRAYCLACCSFLPWCPQGAQELEGFPDTVWQPLRFSQRGTKEQGLARTGPHMVS